MAGPANSINEATTGITGFSGTAFVGSPATQHCVQVGGATTSTLASVTNGTTGQVLTAVTGADPTFQSSTLINLGTKTASNSASITFTSVITSTYKNYLLVYNNVVVGGGGDSNLYIQVSTDNGATYLNTGYNALLCYFGSGTGTVTQTTEFVLLTGNDSSNPSNGSFMLGGFATALASSLTGTSFTKNGANMFCELCGGTGPANANAIKLFSGTTNLVTGTFTLYGLP